MQPRILRVWNQKFCLNKTVLSGLVYIKQLFKRCLNTNRIRRTEYISQCDAASPLLYTLPDSSLTASSIWQNDNDARGPKRSRLFTQFNEGVAAEAWLADRNLDEEHWIKADLLTSRPVQAVALWPRDSIHFHWVTSFSLRFSLDDVSYDVITAQSGEERIFMGSTGQGDNVVANFNVTDARYVRLYPLTYEVHIAVKWEIYACLPGLCEK